MKVTATTLPYSSWRESRWPSWVVRLNAGAGPICGRPLPSPAVSPGVSNSQPTTARTISMPTHHPVRTCTSTLSYTGRFFSLSQTGKGAGSLPLLLQFPFELGEEAPVGALGDKLLGAALDHPHLVQAQGIEAHRILVVVLTP